MDAPDVSVRGDVDAHVIGERNLEQPYEQIGRHRGDLRSDAIESAQTADEPRRRRLIAPDAAGMAVVLISEAPNGGEKEPRRDVGKAVKRSGRPHRSLPLLLRQLGEPIEGELRIRCSLAHLPRDLPHRVGAHLLLCEAREEEPMGSSVEIGDDRISLGTRRREHNGVSRWGVHLCLPLCYEAVAQRSPTSFRRPAIGDARSNPIIARHALGVYGRPEPLSPMGGSDRVTSRTRVPIHPHGKLDLMSTVSPPSPVFESYWRFVAERHRVYERRLQGLPAPWTVDQVLSAYRFTNVFRAADRVSQYLISEIICRGDQAVDELVFRILLFKLFNKIETWKLLVDEFGDVTLSTFDIEAADRLLGAARARGTRIYSNAYIVPPIAGADGVKHRGHLRLVATMIRDGLPRRIRDSDSLEEVYLILRSYPGIGNFLAYQFAIDINYSDATSHDEDEFVVAGPGALDGVSKVFPGLDLRKAAEVIRRMTDEQEEWLSHYHLSFSGLFGRRLHLIDVQNIFCEISKYARVAHPDVPGVSGRTRIKQAFRPAGPVPMPRFPPKWGLDVPVEHGRRAPDPELVSAQL